ncbi:MAG: hypothetical protein HOJ15_01130 [Candidatus Jacksonbacteria bacterium]|jgi:protein-tyrosine phosphatase|nr:hypothetical protein [Candidatus Jacksonbacteria bacterium]MBT6034620.1 hypothetical protein [Candidatus Jacksonbacteria bacterium]MBT6301015.1 hypothetical protein [Candidatus Jacksonbacteria bacterium]MBT6757196.1 hypothetical protein [Candidatus Jacksonbacteria bacterium]MBT6954843.1 hypothetical protein [Candidatus Jacksonbacteria bacterium]
MIQKLKALFSSNNKHKPSKGAVAHTFEYSKIDDFISIGTNACCVGHFDKKLLKEGVKADLSLDKEHIDQPFGVDYFLWIPITDHHAPTQKQLEVAVQFLDTMKCEGLAVYIHCHEGHGRAPTVAAAYYISQGKSVEEALEYIAKKRSTIHPNKKQIAALRAYEKSLKNK